MRIAVDEAGLDDEHRAQLWQYLQYAAAEHGERPRSDTDAVTGTSTLAGWPVQWWRDAVVYQVYVRSFADADGDGIGDLRRASAPGWATWSCSAWTRSG